MAGISAVGYAYGRFKVDSETSQKVESDSDNEQKTKDVGAAKDEDLGQSFDSFSSDKVDEGLEPLDQKTDAGLVKIDDGLDALDQKVDDDLTDISGAGETTIIYNTTINNYTAEPSDEFTAQFNDLTDQLDRLTEQVGDLSDKIGDFGKLINKFSSLVGKIQFGGAAGQNPIGDLNIGRATLSLGSGGSLQRLNAALRFADRGYQHFDRIFNSGGNSSALGDIASSLDSSVSRLQSQLGGLQNNQQNFSLLA